MFKWVLRLPKYPLHIPSTWYQGVGRLPLILQWTTLRCLNLNSLFPSCKRLKIHRNLVPSWLSRNDYTQAPYTAHRVLWLTHNLYLHLNCLRYILEIYQLPLRPVPRPQARESSFQMHPQMDLIWLHLSISRRLTPWTIRLWNLIQCHLLHPHPKIPIGRILKYQSLQITPTHSVTGLTPTIRERRSVLVILIPQLQVLDRPAISLQWHVLRITNLHWAH